MKSLLPVAYHLITLHALNGDLLLVNPHNITSMRDRAAQNENDDSVLAKGIECLINTNDGKYISVVEHCDAVQRMIEGAEIK